MNKRLKSVTILHGLSRYEVFAHWQEALRVAFARQGVPARIAPATESVGPNEISLGFDLVRDWRVSNQDVHHLVWMVDHPALFPEFFFPQISRMPVNPRRCAVGLVDEERTAFAREVYRYPNAFFLPHAATLIADSPTPWAERDLEVVFAGSIENPDTVAQRLRKAAGKLAPLVDSILREFSFESGLSLPLYILGRTADAGFSPQNSILFLNAFYPDVYRVVWCRHRIASLNAACAFRAVHVFGAGPWSALNLSPRAIVHPAVPFPQLRDLFGRARVVLSHAPELRKGSHERVLNALACGCRVVSTPSDFMASAFGVENGFVQTDAATGLGEIVERALSEPDAGERVLATREIVLASHTMDDRARRLTEAVAALWPETIAEAMP